MTVATVTTDINIGPFKIPANGQNMIMINYAQRNNLAVELAIPEPMKSPIQQSKKLKLKVAKRKKVATLALQSRSRTPANSQTNT